MERFECQARVLFRGETLALNKIVADIEIDDLIPPKVFDPTFIIDYSQRAERRQRFFDLISAEFAHALTEAIFKLGGK